MNSIEERLIRTLVALGCVGFSAVLFAHPLCASPSSRVQTGPVAMARLHAEPSTSPLQRSLAEARSEARQNLIRNLEQLAEWCTKKKLFAYRVGVFNSILHFEPQHTVSLRGLGFVKDPEGNWVMPQKTKSSKKQRALKNWDKSAARKFPRRRAELVVEYREEMLALLEEFSAEVDEATRLDIYADILFGDPDDLVVHELMGETKVGEAWVLKQTPVAKARRAELREAVKRAFSSAPKAVRGEPNAREKAIGVEWKAVFVTPEVRSLGTGGEREIERMTTAMHAARSYFKACLGLEAKYPDPLTVFTLTRASDKLAFLMGHPNIDGDYRKFLMELDGSGIQGSGDLAHWSEEEQHRLDGMVRQAISWLFAGGPGIGPEHGWAFEGFGLYMTRELVGTRLTWFVRKSELLNSEQDSALKVRLIDSRANWMNEAHKLFSSGKSVELKSLLTKNVNQLKTEDLLYSYVLAAYLLEAEADKLPTLLREIGAGMASQEAFEQVLGLDVEHLDARVSRWLSERR